jgi:hypothetical protein
MFWNDLSKALGLPASRPSASLAARPGCASCRHFRNDPAYLEAAIPGLASLSSGWASVRSDDGLCLLRERHTSARFSCGDYAVATR